MKIQIDIENIISEINKDIIIDNNIIFRRIITRILNAKYSHELKNGYCCKCAIIGSNLLDYIEDSSVFHVSRYHNTNLVGVIQNLEVYNPHNYDIFPDEIELFKDVSDMNKKIIMKLRKQKLNRILYV